MITQYSHIQLTLSEKEKEYAWFQYAAELCKAGCRDQSLSGYSVNGTGIDGKPVKAELTNEELFQLFAEITMKYGKRMLREHENSQKNQQEIEQIMPDEENQNKINPLDRRDFQIMITKNEQKTRKADVQITWGNNLQIEGIQNYSMENEQFVIRCVLSYDNMLMISKYSLSETDTKDKLYLVPFTDNSLSN